MQHKKERKQTMGNRLCVVDLDGVVADSTARFAKAEEAKQRFIADMRLGNILSSSKPWSERAVDVYWKTAFSPELVSLDTLIAGVPQALDALAADGYRVLFLTSRPESMRAATIQWLDGHDLLRAWSHTPRIMTPARELAMKASAFQYTKTVLWKVGMVQTLVGMFDASEVLFVDDEEANCEAMRASGLGDIVILHCRASLAEAIRS
jgi:phosphoglycolate phosphatase-like HAD superfamily hydrolase